MKVAVLHSRYTFSPNFEIILNDANQVNSHFVTAEFKIPFYSVLLSHKQPYSFYQSPTATYFRLDFIL
jgi:hypothetical protein